MNSKKTILLAIAACAAISCLSTWLTMQYTGRSFANPFFDSKFIHEVNNAPNQISNESLVSLANLANVGQGNFILAAARKL